MQKIERGELRTLTAGKHDCVTPPLGFQNGLVMRLG